MDSMKEKQEVMQKFFSTYSGRIENELLANLGEKQEQNNLQTHRMNKHTKFGFPESPDIFKGDSHLDSDREINKNLMNIDDSLSDVPVKEVQEMDEDLGQNFSIEYSERFLDGLSMLSPIDLDLSKNDYSKQSDKKHSTPSFKMNEFSRHKRKRALDIRSMDVDTILNFDGPFPNIPLLDL